MLFFGTAFFNFSFMKRYVLLTFICINLFEFVMAQCDTIKATYSYCTEEQGGLYPNNTDRKYYYYTFEYDNVTYAVAVEEHGTIFRDWCIILGEKSFLDTISTESMNITLRLVPNKPSSRGGNMTTYYSQSALSWSCNVELPKYVSLKQQFDYKELNSILTNFLSELTTNPRLSTFVNTEPYSYYSKRHTIVRSKEDGIITVDEALKQIQKDVDSRAYYDSTMYQYDIDFLSMIIKDFNELYGPQYHTITYLDWDGTELGTEKVKKGVYAIGEPTITPSRDGYTFIGWSKDIENVTKDIIVVALYQSKTGITSLNDYKKSAKPQKIFKNGEFYILLPDGNKINIDGTKH